MRWEDTWYIKLYRPPAWSQWRELPLEVRGFFDELMLVVDAAGLLECGHEATNTIARAVGGDPERVAIYMDALLADGAVILSRHEDGAYILVIRNFIEAQGARATDRMRREQSRQRARDSVLRKAKPVNERQQNLPLLVTPHTPASHAATRVDTVRLQDIQERQEREDQPAAIETVQPAPTHTTEEQAFFDGLHAAARGKIQEP